MKDFREDVIEVRKAIDNEYIEVAILYSIEGKHRPATWGWNGGDPEEFPEIEIEKIVDLSTGMELKETDIIFNRSVWSDKVTMLYLSDKGNESHES